MPTSSPDATRTLLANTGLPEDFLDKLIHESDWSGIIKLHALFEAVLGSLIVKEMKNPALEEAVAHLDFNNIKSGKVAFARSLGLLNSREIAFLRGLSELRNQLVHDVRNVNFKLLSFVANMTASQQKKFRSEFGSAIISLDDGEKIYQEFLSKQPSLIIHSAAYDCLLNLHHNFSASKRNMLVKALMEYSSK